MYVIVIIFAINQRLMVLIKYFLKIKIPINNIIKILKEKKNIIF